jgi:hypothetical protein
MRKLKFREKNIMQLRSVRSELEIGSSNIGSPAFPKTTHCSHAK